MPEDRVAARVLRAAPAAAEAGFTLLETVVAVAILGLLAAASFPLAGAFVDVLLQQKTEAELDRVAAAVEKFFEDTGAFPAELSELEWRPAGAAGWSGPYLLPEFATDPASQDDYRYDAWRRAYQYLSTSAAVRTIRSFGPNGANDNGLGDDVDRVVDASPFLRERTVAEMRSIGAAIVAYNISHLPDDLLPNDWAAAVGALQAAGCLPAGAAAANEYTFDAWGRAYVPGPQPTTHVTSLGPP